MSLDHRLAPFREALERELLELGALSGGDEIDAAPGAALVARQLATGGKRLRGLLPPALVQAGSGDTGAALTFGACVEAVHNGTLVHDDIQDRDTLRRGRPTLWTEVGVPQALNVGDAMLIAPIVRLLGSRGSRRELALELGTLLGRALLQTIHGQVADVALRERAEIDFERALAVARAKTSPLFACALAGSAAVLRLSDRARTRAAAAGSAIGVAFQIRDDLLDVLGTKGRGTAGADLREGKPTWPVIAACKRAPPPRARALRELLRRAAGGQVPGDRETADWIDWLHACGAVDETRTALATALQQARAAASDVFGREGGEVIGRLCDRLAVADG